MSLFDPLSGGQNIEVPRCSRKGCPQDARWQILWNNPRLHAPDRRKVWLACSEHRSWLEDYLHLRGFWKQTLALDVAANSSMESEEH